MFGESFFFIKRPLHKFSIFITVELLFISQGLTDKVITYGADNQALSLEASDTLVEFDVSVQWSFLGDQVFTSGKVAVQMQLEFNAVDEYRIAVKAHDDPSVIFVDVNFNSDNEIVVSDSNGVLGAVDSYIENKMYVFCLVFDLDEGSYTLLLDGDELVSNEAIPLTNGLGIGVVITGFLPQTSECVGLTVDELKVAATTARPDLIFQAGFESIENR